MVRLIEGIEGMRSMEGPLHIAMGVFDGLHIGHQAVISEAVKAAHEDGGIAAVLTFDPHPIRVIAPQIAPRRILASLNHKRELLSKFGVDALIVVHFTEEFADCEADDFLLSLVNANSGLESLSVGEDWKFGKNRRGDVTLMEKFATRHGIRVNTTKAVMMNGERVSSTRIRQAIRDGNMVAARDMLGRDYTVLGTVVEGRQLGRTLGLPTANLRVHNEQLPSDGVWCVQANLGHGDAVQGVANLGKRPTVEGGHAKRMLEVHLLDFSGDLYGSEMEVTFLHHVRPEQKFANLDELQNRIRQDIGICRERCGP